MSGTAAEVSVVHASAERGIVSNDNRMGSVIRRLIANDMNPAALRTNDVLFNRDWIAVDQKIIMVARQRLVGVADLFAKGLTYPIAQALGVTRIEWEKISDMGTADVNMSGVAEGENDRILWDLDYLPLPIVHKNFNLNIRALTASRRMGHPIDTTQVALATRIVVEKLEDILFNGGLNVGSQGQVYGYTNAPNAKTGILGGDWSTSGTTYTGEQRLADLQTIFDALGNAPNYMKGPYMIYMPTAWYNRLGDDFKTYSDRTILERFLAMPQVQGIKPSSNLDTAGKMVVIQMTDDVVDLIDGIQPMAVSWPSEGGMVENFKIMAILVPRLKSTYSGQSGVYVATNG